MEGADEIEERRVWEALYMELPVHDTWNQSTWTINSWNSSGWNGTSFNATFSPNVTWWEDPFAPFDTPAGLIRAGAMAVVLGLLILATVIGKHFFISFSLV